MLVRIPIFCLMPTTYVKKDLVFAGSDTAVRLIQGSLNVAAYAGTQGLIPGVCFQFTPTYEVLSA